MYGFLICPQATKIKVNSLTSKHFWEFLFWNFWLKTHKWSSLGELATSIDWNSEQNMWFHHYWFEVQCDRAHTELTPVLFFLVSNRETVKEAAKFGELRTSLRFSRHSPKNLHQQEKQMSQWIYFTKFFSSPVRTVEMRVNFCTMLSAKNVS